MNVLFEYAGISYVIVVAIASLAALAIGHGIHRMSPPDPNEGHGPIDEAERRRLERAAAWGHSHARKRT